MASADLACDHRDAGANRGHLRRAGGAPRKATNGQASGTAGPQGFMITGAGLGAIGPDQGLSRVGLRGLEPLTSSLSALSGRECPACGLSSYISDRPARGAGE